MFFSFIWTGWRKRRWVSKAFSNYRQVNSMDWRLERDFHVRFRSRLLPAVRTSARSWSLSTDGGYLVPVSKNRSSVLRNSVQNHKPSRSMFDLWNSSYLHCVVTDRSEHIKSFIECPGRRTEPNGECLMSQWTLEITRKKWNNCLNAFFSPIGSWSVASLHSMKFLIFSSLLQIDFRLVGCRPCPQQSNVSCKCQCASRLTYTRLNYSFRKVNLFYKASSIRRHVLHFDIEKTKRKTRY